MHYDNIIRCFLGSICPSKPQTAISF